MAKKAKKAKKAKSRTKKRKAGKRAAPKRRSRRPRPLRRQSPLPPQARHRLTPLRPRGRRWVARPGAAAAVRAAGPPRNTHRDRRTGLTLAPVGSFSLREREPIASGVGGAHRRTAARAGSRRPRKRQAAATQLRGDGEPNSIARARGIDALLLPHPPRGGGSLCRRLTTS